MITQERDGWELPGWQRQQADLITDPTELLRLLRLEAESLPVAWPQRRISPFACPVAMCV